MTIRSYTKVLTLGSRGTENVFKGFVVVQEKIDGSQFRFGIDDEGHMVFGSHRKELFPGAPEKMFKQAMSTAIAGLNQLLIDNSGLREVTFFAEYLQKPKHNALAYDKTPLGNLVLFDVVYGADRGFATRFELETFAQRMGIDVVPELWRGSDCTVEILVGLHETESYLGGQKVEGVVAKNYGQLIEVHGRLYPVFAKLVSEQFKERNTKEWKQKSGKSKLETLFAEFATEARWAKAVQHLEELGELDGSPKDIGPLMKELHRDLRDEETENIKDALFNLHIKGLLRTATRGFPDWYKSQLLATLGQDK